MDERSAVRGVLFGLLFSVPFWVVLVVVVRLLLQFCSRCTVAGDTLDAFWY